MNQLRMRSPKMIAALLVSLVAFMPMVGQSSSQTAKQVQLRIVNNGTTPVKYEVCAVHGKSYLSDPEPDPCSITTREYASLSAGGDRKFYWGNPVRVVMTVNKKVLFFLAFNPSVGKPYLKVNGDTVRMFEGELQVRHPSGIAIRFHREGDTAHKIMTIEVLKS